MIYCLSVIHIQLGTPYFDLLNLAIPSAGAWEVGGGRGEGVGEVGGPRSLLFLLRSTDYTHQDLFFFLLLPIANFTSPQPGLLARQPCPGEQLAPQLAI